MQNQYVLYYNRFVDYYKESGMSMPTSVGDTDAILPEYMDYQITCTTKAPQAIHERKASPLEESAEGLEKGGSSTEPLYPGS